MKTTLDLDDALLRRAKQAALDRRTTLRAVVEEALARALGPTSAVAAPPRSIVWPQRRPRGAAPAPSEAAIDASIARERADPGDDPVRLARRLGPDMPKVGRR